MDRAALDVRFRVAFLLWASLLAGVTLFACVAWAIAGGLLAPAFTASLAPALASKLLVMVPVLLVAGIVYRNGDVGTRGDTGTRLVAWQTRMTVASALQEGGGLLGLVVCLLADRPTWMLGVWVVTAVAMLLGRPRREELDRLLR